jgi:ABC-type glycerol-3-phosphate transport system permease component
MPDPRPAASHDPAPPSGPAASAIVLIPSVTLFVFLRRQFTQGIATSGLKD